MGKSILLRQIRDANPEENHYSVPERGGNITYESRIVAQELDGKSRVTGSKQNLAPDYRTGVITRIAAYLTKRGAFRGQIDGDDLTSSKRHHFFFGLSETRGKVLKSSVRNDDLLRISSFALT